MKQLFIVIISFFITSLMASCVTTPPQPQPSPTRSMQGSSIGTNLDNCPTCPTCPVEGLVFQTQTSSNEQATDQFVKFLTQNAFTVKRLGESHLRVDYDGGKFLMQPKASENGLDRIVVSKLFGVKEQYRNTIEILAFVVKLNNKLNIGQFSLSDDSETLIILSNITFVNKLELVEFRKFMKFFNDSVKAIITTVPDTVKYLE